jgi:hypothetical protein
LEFDDTIETVRAIVTRLNSPVSEYNLVFSESDDAVEVRVETTRQLKPLFVFVVDAERLRIVKDLEVKPEGYKSVTYSGCVELLSLISENFYPVFFKINRGGSIMEMLSRVLGENIRIWKDLVRVICKSGGIEFFDFGDTVSFADSNFSYNLDSHILKVSGEVNESVKCISVMELVTAILVIMDYMFKREELDVNPILGDRLVDEGSGEFDFDDLSETMDMDSELDAVGGSGGEDLSSEFEPSEEGLLNTAPDLDEGKDMVLDEVYEE